MVPGDSARVVLGRQRSQPKSKKTAQSHSGKQNQQCTACGALVGCLVPKHVAAARLTSSLLNAAVLQANPPITHISAIKYFICHYNLTRTAALPISTTAVRAPPESGGPTRSPLPLQGETHRAAHSPARHESVLLRRFFPLLGVGALRWRAVPMLLRKRYPLLPCRPQRVARRRVVGAGLALLTPRTRIRLSASPPMRVRECIPL